MPGIKKIFMERGLNWKTFQMDQDDFTRGIQMTKIQINKKEYSLASGFMGVEFNNEPCPKYAGDVVQWVRPAVGWALYEDDPNKPAEMKNVFISAETSGSLF